MLCKRVTSHTWLWIRGLGLAMFVLQHAQARGEGTKGVCVSHEAWELWGGGGGGGVIMRQTLLDHSYT